MTLEPPPLISKEPPRSRRRRRRAQQQSSCCCCLIVVLSMLFVIIAWRGAISSLFHRHHSAAEIQKSVFPLELKTDAPSYLRYNLVRLEATLVDAQGRPQVGVEAPEVVVKHEGQVVTTVGGVDRITLRYDSKRQNYVMTWPVPWNCPPGVYVAEARLKIADPAQWDWETPEQAKERVRREKRKEQAHTPKASGRAYCIARTRFVINARPIAAIPPGTCIATWEPDFQPDGITRPDGTEGDWRSMFKWCEYTGADTFWARGAVTEAYQGALSDEHPFNEYNIQQIPKLAAEAHRNKLRFGTWAAAYATYPQDNNRDKPPYRFAQDVSRASGAIKSLDFVSLLEPKRVNHIANFFAQVQQDPNVDYVGLDYMRGDNGGYEMTDVFAREMPVKLPKDFFSRSTAGRWGFVAGKIEREWQTDPNFYDAWNWWRAHKVAENLRDIIDQAQLKKPLWIFVLSWWHGKQHGQDPLMFSDAGASLLAPMLYQIPNRAHFDSMVNDWNEYVNYGQVNLAPGDQVDFNWHQSMLQPKSAPEELYDRIVTAHRRYLRNGLTVGGFLHDIGRAESLQRRQGGRRGPFPGNEWALAGGAAFSTIRNDWQVYPLVAEMQAPPTASVGGTVDATITLTNIVKKNIKRITITVEKTVGIEAVTQTKTIPSLGDGQTLTVPLTVRLKGPNAARANRFMICARITWPDDDYGKKVRRDLPPMMLVMKYVQGR